MPALPPTTDITDPARTQGQAKTWMSGVRDYLATLLGTDGVPGTALAKLGALGFSMLNGTLVASNNGTVLTVAIKTKAGTDPSATDPVTILFRNATAATGDYETILLTSATSISTVVGGTFGMANNIPFRLWVVGFNDGGTFRLGLVNCLTLAVAGASAAVIRALRDDVLDSGTQIGVGSDSTQIIYTFGAAVASKAMRVLGYLEYNVGLATAGTFPSNPTKLQLFGPGISLPGQPVQWANSYNLTGSANNSVAYANVTNGVIALEAKSKLNAVQVDFSWNATQGSVGAANVIYYANIVRNDAVVPSGADAFVMTNTTPGGGTAMQGGMAFNYLDSPLVLGTLSYTLQHRITNTGGVGASSSAISRRATEIMA